MKVLYNTLFFLFFFLATYSSNANDSLTLKINAKENKKNILKPVVDDEKSNTTINPVLREQMSDDELNPQPVPNTNHKQTEPPIGKDFIEKWEITSARTSAPGSVDAFYMLSPASYVKFFELNRVAVKINENFPEQIGIFSQSERSIKIHFNPASNCSNCIKDLEITRKTIEDKFFTLKFDNMEQIITVQTIR